MSLFGQPANPNEWAGNPSNPIYTAAINGFYNNLLKRLNAMSPGRTGLIGLAMSQGGDYGGSTYIANKQNENILARNRDTAAGASQGFASNLYGQGLGLYGQGKIWAASQPTIGNELLNTVGGVAGLGVGNIFSGKGFFGNSNPMPDYTTQQNFGAGNYIWRQ